MSYILDAIKKSDQQRQRGATPTLQTSQATIEVPKQPALLVYGLIVVILISAGIIIGIQRPWQDEQLSPVHTAVIEKPFESNPQENAPAPQSGLSHGISRTEKDLPTQKPAATVQGASASALASPSPSITQGAVANTKSETPGTPVKTAVSPQKNGVTLVTEKTTETVLTSAPQEQKIMTIAELPPAIQQEIPKMAISVHVYSSKPKDRLVGINERMLREGDELSPGLKLEQITHEDMVFGYKGFHFRRSVQ